MTIVQTMVKFAALGEILRAAQVLERHGLLPMGESANGIVRRFVAANPEINAALTPKEPTA